MSDGAHNLDPSLIPEQSGGGAENRGTPQNRAGKSGKRPGTGDLRLERRAVRRGDDAPRLPGEPGRPAEPADLFDEDDEAPTMTGASRERGVGRRLAESLRAAEVGELTKEQFLFVMAIDAFKRENGVSFPAWTDVLELIRLLGYRKTQATELTLRNAEDWTERPDSPSNVRPKNFDRRRAA